ncbi:MAG: PQQ-dependent dehydrogenase, methanol/ethanol family [Halioglobus sp.]
MPGILHRLTRVTYPTLNLSWFLGLGFSLVLASSCSMVEPDGSNLSAASVPDTQWALHGNDIGEQRHSALSQINQNNVAELGLAWSFDLPTVRGVEATPLMVNSTLYTTGSWSTVYALDATTGEQKWSYDPLVDRSFLAKGCCGAVNRGVAYHDGKIVFATYDGRLIGLNADTGEPIWEVQTTDREQSYTITGAPRLAGDLVVIGNGGAELGVRGYVTAYRVETGEQVWRWYTVPGNPAEGFENDAMAMAAKTWNGTWWEWGGGGTVWDSMVYDPELGLFYIGVGNGAPWNQSMRSPGGGDNLFLASVVALNAKTGEYVWHYQTTPGDTWDYTATQHMILANLDIEGQQRKVLMQAPKNGFFYVLDRVTGELISAEPYAYLTWSSGIDKSTGRPIETANARVFDGKNITLPSNAGAHNWQPMSYNPDTGLVYIPTMVFPIAFKEPSEEKDMKPGQGYWNVGFDRMANSPPKIPNLGEVFAKEYTGKLLAWDPVQQKAVWSPEVGKPNVGGALSTAGGLVFHGGEDDLFNAYDAASGERLWSTDLQTSAVAPITYALNGEQYVVLMAGIGGGFSSEGGPVAHDWNLPTKSRVLAFKLGGKAKLPPRDDVPEPMPKPAPVTAGADVLYRGEVMYQRHCAYCHGDGFRTGGVNPDLRRSSPEIHGLWQQIVRDGILKSVGMVGFAQFLSESDAEAIRQYTLAEANRIYALEHAAGGASEPAN